MGPSQTRLIHTPHQLNIYAPCQINPFPHLAMEGARIPKTVYLVGRDRSVRRKMGSSDEYRSRSDQQELVFIPLLLCKIKQIEYTVYLYR